MYEPVCTRPDIAFAVGMLGRYQDNRGIAYWKATKWVLRNLQGTKDYILIYRQSDYLKVAEYLDSYLIGSIDTSKSTSGYIFFLLEVYLGEKINQSIIASSTMEVEFLVCYETTSLALWLNNFILGLKIVDIISRPLKIFCDN
ncbi:hypothetical protein ACH5RR_029365 [Cinchona calisaya]|uniref:Uncharacterized protein n=1 Tax=Cinchona calisaya TaxID=153742 RepID=A0ABD2YUU5_9GENT